MKCITIVVSAADMPAIRKVVFIAGANKLVIAQVPHLTCIGELDDWYCGTHIAPREDHMRLEITSDDTRSDGVFSAILSTAHTAKIERITSGMNDTGSKDSYIPLSNMWNSAPGQAYPPYHGLRKTHNLQCHL